MIDIVIVETENFVSDSNNSTIINNIYVLI